MFEGVPRRPSWLSRSDYELFIKLHPLVCTECGSTHDMTIDHIIPRHSGGTHALTNLRWLCRRCNSAKWAHPDPFYWSQNFYWDNHFDQMKLRNFQRACIVEPIIDYGEAWFSQPWSHISGRLYLCAAIVAAGKTLAMPTLAFALNFVVRRDFGPSAPRVDRLLILTTQQGLRSQIADEIRTELTRYEICALAPRVKEIQFGQQMNSRETVETADVWVGCTAMFYEKNGQPKDDLHQILARFPLICLDEPHWALAQNLQIVEAAPLSLCFGFTGTPIDADGDAIKTFVLVSSYNYDQAVENDQSLKLIVGGKDEFGHVLDDETKEIIYEIPIEEGFTLEKGQEKSVTDVANIPGYSDALIPAKTVADHVIGYLLDSDMNRQSVRAKHRPESVVVNNYYWMHAIIKVADKPIGDYLVQHLNRIFESQRDKYPRSKGWNADLVISEGEDEINGRRLRGSRLDAGHAFMRCKRQKGQIDDRCSRIVVVVGMGREGTNNPLVGVYGLAAKAHSMIFDVQAPIGRTLRGVSFTEVFEDGREVVHVPPSRMDTVKIITHEAYDNLPQLIEALHYCLHMDEKFEQIPTLEHLVNGESDASITEVESDVIFTDHERLLVAAKVGRAKREGEAIIRSEIEREWRDAPEKKRQKVADWLHLVDNYPHDARDVMGYVPQDDMQLDPGLIVNRERYSYNPSDEDLVRFVHHVKPEFIKYLAEFQTYRVFFLDMYITHAKSYTIPEIETTMKLSMIHKYYVREVRDSIRDNICGDESLIYKAVGRAMRMKLDVPKGQQFHDGGPWDTAPCHAMLRRPAVRREIIKCAQNYLIRRGCCPDLAQAFEIKIAVDEDTEDDEENGR